MALLHVTTGKENNRTSSANIGAFLHVAGEEVPLFAAKSKDKFKNMIGDVGVPQHYQARRGIANNVGGSWVAADYQIPDGTLVKLSISKSQHGQRLHVQLFLHMRTNAAFNRLTIPLRLSRHSAVEEGIIEGRFDILTFEQAKDKGAVMPDHFERLFSPLMVNRLLTVTVVEPEAEPMPVVEMRTITTDEGTQVRVQARKRKRSLDT